MDAKDIRAAVEYALDSYEGEPVRIADTIVVGMDSETGRYWLVDAGDKITGLDYDGVLNYCLESLAD